MKAETGNDGHDKVEVGNGKEQAGSFPNHNNGGGGAQRRRGTCHREGVPGGSRVHPPNIPGS